MVARASASLASGGLVPAHACPEFFEALFQAILNDFHRLACRLRCGGCALCRSLDRNFEDLLGELRLQGEVILNFSERLISTSQARRLAKPRFQHLALFFRYRLSALRGYS